MASHQSVAIQRIVGEPDELAGSFKRLPHTAFGWSASVSGFSVILRDRSSAHARYSSIQTSDVANIACLSSLAIYSYYMERRSRFCGACLTSWDSNNHILPTVDCVLRYYGLTLCFTIRYGTAERITAISLLSDEVLTAVRMPMLSLSYDVTRFWLPRSPDD